MNKPHTIEELKLSIHQEIEALLNKMLQRAMQSFEERLRLCVWQEGCHLTEIIFQTLLRHVNSKNALKSFLFDVIKKNLSLKHAKLFSCENHEFPLLHPV